MARWTDLATWRGPTPNQSGSMTEQRGLVLHIAVGWYEGTIAWQRNPDSNVSSHFVVGRERGELAQMVDTAVRAWTQGDGNGRWLSSENEGFLANDSRNPGGWERLSDWQIEANAQLLAEAHQVYGVPLKVADHPGERGLGHHSMDREWLDEQWGHDECPGRAIVAQKPLIVARAKEIVGGDDMTKEEMLELLQWALPRVRYDLTYRGERTWAGQMMGRDNISGQQLAQWSLGVAVHKEAMPAIAELQGQLAGMAALVEQLATAPPVPVTPEQLAAMTAAVAAAARLPGQRIAAALAAAGNELGDLDEEPE